MTLEDLTFRNNYANTCQCNSLQITSSMAATMTRLVFEDNESNDDCFYGSMHVVFSGDVKLLISDSTWTDNESPENSGLSIHGNDVELENLLF